MMKNKMKTEHSYPLIQLSELQKSQISDLADGQLQGEVFAQTMALMNASSLARAQWNSLHLIGDVLRGKTPVSSADDADFLEKFRTNMAKEPVLQAANHVAPVKFEQTTAANEPFFSWKWAAGLSALAASVVLGLNLIGTTTVAPAAPGGQLAQVSVPISADGPAAVMLRNPQLDALIAAHNQASGSSAFQMPSGFLRSATYSPTLASDK
jgi:sigma-E factor negative regulatory protein RseA